MGVSLKGISENQTANALGRCPEALLYVAVLRTLARWALITGGCSENAIAHLWAISLRSDKYTRPGDSIVGVLNLILLRFKERISVNLLFMVLLLNNFSHERCEREFSIIRINSGRNSECVEASVPHRALSPRSLFFPSVSVFLTSSFFHYLNTSCSSVYIWNIKMSYLGGGGLDTSQLARNCQ